MAYELAATWRWLTLAQMNHSELLHMAGAVDGSTINIVVVIITIIIIITKMSAYHLMCVHIFCSSCNGDYDVIMY